MLGVDGGPWIQQHHVGREVGLLPRSLRHELGLIDQRHRDPSHAVDEVAVEQHLARVRLLSLIDNQSAQIGQHLLHILCRGHHGTAVGHQRCNRQEHDRGIGILRIGRHESHRLVPPRLGVVVAWQLIPENALASDGEQRLDVHDHAAVRGGLDDGGLGEHVDDIFERGHGHR